MWAKGMSSFLTLISDPVNRHGVRVGRVGEEQGRLVNCFSAIPTSLSWFTPKVEIHVGKHYIICLFHTQSFKLLQNITTTSHILCVIRRIQYVHVIVWNLIFHVIFWSPTPDSITHTHIIKGFIQEFLLHGGGDMLNLMCTALPKFLHLIS